MTTAPTTLEQLRARHGERYKWLVLGTVMVGTMASFMASTIVNVAVPELSRYFILTQERAQWLSAAFLVAMIPALSVTPWLLQRYGLRRTYVAANLLLMASSVVGGLSGNFELLIAMRAAEGIACGILQPIPAIVIMRAFVPGEQGRAIGYFGLGVVLAPALGPSLGGFLVEHFGWRSIFFVVIPFGLAALALTRVFLPVVSAFVQEKKPLDRTGLVLVSVATVLLLNGLADLNRAGSLQPWILIGVGIAAMVAFVLYEIRVPEPLLRMRLFSHGSFLVGAMVSFIYGFGIFGSTYLLPVFLQMALEYTPSQAGLVLLPAGLALAFTMPVAGRLADVLAPAPLVVFGVLLLVLSLVLTAHVTETSAYAAVIAWVVIGRIGLGIIHPALSIGTVRGLPPGDLAQAMSMSSFVRQLGGAFGVSLAGVLLDWRLTLNGVEDTDPQAPGMIVAFEETFLCLAAVSAAAALAAWFLGRQPRLLRKSQGG